jgi:dephospho-CoA kinase
VERYGKGILSQDGRINRKELAKLVFAGSKQYLAFNHLVFPFLNRALKSAICNMRSKMTILDMAVLFESGFYRYCDSVVFVKAPERLIRKRLKARNRGSVVKALKYQKLFNANKKIALSDFILYNDKNRAALQRAAGELILGIKDKYGYN